MRAVHFTPIWFLAACGSSASDVAAGTSDVQADASTQLAETSPPEDATHAPVDAVDSSAPDTPEVAAIPLGPGDLTYSAPEPWADPIADYLAAGRQEVGSDLFDRAIQDLAPFDGRLFIGYGDATKNLGRIVAIEPRSFGDPEEPVASADFATDEEQIDHYRVFDDRIAIAGVDATEDGWLGNVYARITGGVWTKNRTVDGGVHVHDITAFSGAYWTVGSGASPNEWKSNHIFSYLWRSWDGLAP